MSREFDLIVFIGRFQLFHLGHLAILGEALKRADRVVVVLGSAFGARTPKNPFSWEERAAVIGASVPEADAERLCFVPVRDYYDNARWNAAVRRGVGVHANEGRRVALIGHFKDHSSAYQDDFPSWERIRCERQGDIDATPLRELYFDPPVFPAGEVLLRDKVPTAMLQFLRLFAHLPEYAQLCRESAVLARERAKWACAPYPPKFLTADAIVRANDHVLLIRRAGDIGAGLWALPGGHVEEDEWSLQAAMRELREETQLGIFEDTLLRAHAGTTTFEHPHRSLRGRTVSLAHFFDLGAVDRLPDVQGNGTEGVPEWVPISRLPDMEGMIFEDHFMMMDVYLGVTNA